MGYPNVPLVAARVRRDEARGLLPSGVDPLVHRQAVKLAHAQGSANSDEVIGREWFAKLKCTGITPRAAGLLVDSCPLDSGGHACT